MDTQNTKISANRQKKMAIVEGLSEKFGKSKAIVFTNYQGLTHKQIESLKKSIKPLKAEYVVAKNSLLQRSLTDKELKLEGEHALEGQTGTMFLYEDVITPLKELAKLIKELNLPSVKFGIMDGVFITGEQVTKLSSLPTREVLLAQLVFGLKFPITGLHRALSWNLQKLVMTLNAVVQSKPVQVTPTSTTNPVNETTTPPVEQAGVKTETQTQEAVSEQPAQPTEESNKEEVKSEGGEN